MSTTQIDETTFQNLHKFSLADIIRRELLPQNPYDVAQETRKQQISIVQKENEPIRKRNL